MGDPSAAAPAVRFGRGARWAVVLGASLAVLAMPVPAGITTQAWRLLAIFVFTVAGLMIQPLPGGAMVLIGIGDGGERRPHAPAGAGRVRRPDRVAGARRVLHVARHAEDRTRAADRILVHPRDRQALARTRLRPGLERPVARQLHPVERRARRRDRLSDREEPGRDLRVAPGPDRAAAGRLPDELPLPVRRDGLRDVPHGAGLQRADRPSRARRDRSRAHVCAMARRIRGPRPGRLRRGADAALPAVSPRDTRDAARRRDRGRGAPTHGTARPRRVAHARHLRPGGHPLDDDRTPRDQLRGRGADRDTPACWSVASSTGTT